MTPHCGYSSCMSVFVSDKRAAARQCVSLDIQPIQMLINTFV